MSSTIARRMLLFVLFFTGASGLIYEVTWHKYLANFIGSQSRSSAIILAVFLGGLSIGYFVFGKLSLGKNPIKLLKLCGLIEVLIGGWAILFLSIEQFLWQTYGSNPLISDWMIVSDILLAIIFMGVPTILMGGTLPLVTQGLSLNLKDSASFHARVYAVNTAGAFIGCLLAGFFLLPRWGLPLTIIQTSFINVIGGFIIILTGMFLKLDKDHVVIKKENLKSQFSSLMNPIIIAGLMVAFLSGFYTICMQTVFIRLVGLTLGSSEYAFSMIVAIFIAMLALGAWQLSKCKSSPALWKNQLFIFIGLTLIYFSVPYWSYINHVVRTIFSSAPPSFYIYQLTLFIVLGSVLVLGIFPMGRTMPLVFTQFARSMRSLGMTVGNFYGVNTIGCVLGALLGGYVSLYYLNLDDIFRLSIGLVVITIILSLNFSDLKFSWKSIQRTLFATSIPIILVLILSVYFLSVNDWDKKQLGHGLFRERKPLKTSYLGKNQFFNSFSIDHQLLFYKDGPTSTIAVYKHEKEKKSSVSLYVNGKNDGNTSRDAPTMKLTAHIPALLSSFENENVAVVGFGTGMTSGSLSLYDEVKRIDCIEISSALRQASGFFSEYNYNILENPKFNFINQDAYKYLSQTDNKYSIIVSEPSNPWVTGVERLFSQEFYNIVIDKLTSEGIYTQWFHLYSISTPTLSLVMNTFSSVFKNLYVFKIHSDLLLIGSKEPLSEDIFSRIEDRVARSEIKSDLKKLNIHSTWQILSLEKWLSSSFFKDKGLNTLAFPKLSYSAGKDFFFGFKFNIDKLFNTPLTAVWKKLSFKHSLFHRYANYKSVHNLEEKIDTQQLMKMTMASCNTAHIEEISETSNASAECINLVINLISMDLVKSSSRYMDSQAKIMDKLRTNSMENMGVYLARGDVNIKKVNELIRTYNMHEHPHFTINPEIMTQIGKLCFKTTEEKSVGCRINFVQTMAIKGHWQIAQNYLDIINSGYEKPVIPSQKLKFLNTVIATAKKASTQIELAYKH